MLCDLLTVRTIVLSQKSNTLTYLLAYKVDLFNIGQVMQKVCQMFLLSQLPWCSLGCVELFSFYRMMLILDIHVEHVSNENLHCNIRVLATFLNKLNKESTSYLSLILTW